MEALPLATLVGSWVAAGTSAITLGATLAYFSQRVWRTFTQYEIYIR